MDADELRAYALELPGAWPDQPWEGVVVKVGPTPGRIFLFPGSEGVAVKAAPTDVGELTAAYPGSAGHAPYLSRRHCVRVRLDGNVPDDELAQLVEASYRLVVAGLPTASRPYPAARPDPGT